MAYADAEKRRQFHRDYYVKNPHYAKSSQEKKRERNRQIIYEHCGNTCNCCGSSKDLEFDHVNPLFKKSRQSLLSIGKADLESQLDNIQVLCHTCHKKKSTAQKNAAWKLFSSLPLKEQEKLIQEFM